MTGRGRFAYSAWDGTQVGFSYDADGLLGEITDDLLYHGDINAALRRLMQEGMTDADGNRMQGLRELLEQLKAERAARLDNYDLGGIYDEISEQLDEVVETEREALEDFLAEARMSDDARREEIATRSAADRRLQLDMLAPDLAGKVRDLQAYEFVSPEARERFTELVEELRRELAQSYFDQVSGAMSDMSAEDMDRTKDMLAELNRMLEQRSRGEEPDFDGFMERYGDFFPEGPETLDELLEAMARRMAAMSAMLNSMTPEQRAQLQGLAQQLLEDMDLRWQVDQLADNLRQAFPDAGWDNGYQFSGDNPLGMAQGTQMMQELGELDQLRQLLQSASTPGALADVDLERVRRLMGDEAADSLGQMSEMARALERAGLLESREGRLELTPLAIRRLGRNALDELFSKLNRDHFGGHRMDSLGVGHERAYETKPHEYGDPFALNIEQTVRNAVRRQGVGTPVTLAPEDFEIERTERTTRASTVLMIDLSLSMPMRDNFLPAKKVAMALHSLISGQFPRDYMGMVGFAESARELRPEELPEVSWDFAYGTNMAHGFMIARRLLGRQGGTKQIIMITDGEPTAHLLPSGEVYFNYPPVRATVDATLREVARCTRDGIRINTFVLDATSYLREFMEKLTQLNGGRVFFTSNDSLGDYVLVDFVENRRKLSHRRRG